MIDKRIRIYLVDSDDNYRNACEFVLSNIRELNVVGSFETIEKAVNRGSVDSPDILILDTKIGEKSICNQLDKIKLNNPNMEVLIHAFLLTEEDVLRLFSCGLCGYIVKTNKFDLKNLLDGIDVILDGGSPLSSEISKILIKHLQNNPDCPLSNREREILSELSKGKNRFEVGRDLEISKFTVKTHLSNIYSKLHVSAKHMAIELAKENRWI